MPEFLSQGREVMLESRCVIIKYIQKIIYLEVFVFSFLVCEVFAMMVLC